MAKTDYQTIDEYHAAFPAPVQKRLQAIRDLVHQAAPEATEVISYQIPAFKLDKKFLIYYAAFTKHLTLSSPWSAAFLQHFAPQLQGMKVSKSVIQFPLDQPLPLNFIRDILVFRKSECMA